MMTSATSRADFIDEDLIWEMLEYGRKAKNEERDEYIRRAEEGKGLTLKEAAVLLYSSDEGVKKRLFAAAGKIKEKIYGKRVVLFAPLYISDYCINNCRYCGYRRSNPARRRRLTMEEIKTEVAILEELGHKRLALETGEDPRNCPIDYVLEAIATIYQVKEKYGSIRRINVNIAATTVENYRLLKKAGIGTYILFQETYHRKTYQDMHPSGPKRDYDWHTTAMDRALTAGIDDVGLGVLFGLYDFRFEVLGLLLHAAHLESNFGVGPHTISVPRLRPAYGIDLTAFPYLVNDDDFRLIVAILRLAVPYTGIILSTRERAAFRDELLNLGVSQISAGSCTGVGGYRRTYGHLFPHLLTDHGDINSGPSGSENNAASESENEECVPQFMVDDHRSLDEVIRSICAGGYIPSFCTACYRVGRTGDRFMALAKSGQIGNVCEPNAILTFKEFLLDYASPATRAVGEETIRHHIEEYISNPAVRQATLERLARIERGERDLYF